MGVAVTHDIDAVLPEADVVNLLRIQHERQRKEYFPGLGEYTALFGLTKKRAEKLKPGALIMHPGPINRGVEIDSEIADSSRSVILDQVTNGLAVRMAVLYLCAGGKRDGPGRRIEGNRRLITNGHIIDPANGINRVGDVYIAGGKIEKIDLDGSARTSDEARDHRRDGLVVAPGLDRHPRPSARTRTIGEGNHRHRHAGRGGGRVYKRRLHAEHIARRGQPERRRMDPRKGRARSLRECLPTGAITKGIAGEELAPIGSMHKAGIVALTDDGHCVQNHELMRRALEYARMFGLPVMDHCQDYNLVGKGVMHEGYWSTVLGLPGWPAAGEEVIVQRNILLAELCDTPIHCQHLSAAGSVRLCARRVRAG